MKHKTGQNGFTLIEVMVAIVVLVIGMVAVMGMQYMSMHGNTVSRQMRVATNFSRDILEQVKSLSYNNLATGIFNPENIFDPDAESYNSSTTGGVDYTRVIWAVPSCSRIQLAGDDNTCDGADDGVFDNNITPLCDPAFVRATNDATAILIRTCWTDKDDVTHSVSFPTVIWSPI